jgi:hypothetical protein
MSAAPRTEPRPFEEVIIASTLESGAGEAALMESIHRLSQERGQLQVRLAQHPWSDREAAVRIQEIRTELEARWAEIRRSRAARRVRMEEALGIDPAASQKTNRPAPKTAAYQAAQSQARRRQRLPLANAS